MRYAIFLVLLLLLGCVGEPQGAPQEPSAPSQPPPAGSGTVQPNGSVPEQPSEPPDVTAPSEPAEPTSGLKSEEITYNSFGWDIHGTLYEAVDKKNPTVGIILVPMLDHSRDSYPQSFIKDLHEQMPNALILAIDLRGQGESTNLGTWDDFQLDDWLGMGVDVREAKRYFKTNYPTADEYYVVGASIGSTAAILAGEQENDVTKVAMLSPGIEYKGVNIEDEVDDYVHPLFVAYTSGDSYSATSASTIGSISNKATVKAYQGSSHGTDMFDDTQLSSDLIEFLKR